MKDQDQRSRQVQDMLNQSRAVIANSHVVYTSGKHGSAYINKDALYPDWRNVDFLCRMIAQDFREEDVQVVVGPVQGATVLAYETARQLTNLTGQWIEWVYAEKDGADGFVLKRGYDELVAGKRVLIVEDVLTTGGSVKKVVDLVRSLGGVVTGVAALVNRGGVTSEMVGSPAKFVSLLEVHMESWDEAVCQLCAEGVHVNTKVGKGKQFLEKKALSA